jgi:octaprenyl-diphosphate synthase
MSLDDASTKPHERLQAALAGDLDATGDLIRARMASEHAPRIPEVTAHLVEAGGKRIRPMLTLAAARLCGYDGRGSPEAGRDGGVHPHRDAPA